MFNNIILSSVKSRVQFHQYYHTENVQIPKNSPDIYGINKLILPHYQQVVSVHTITEDKKDEQFGKFSRNMTTNLLSSLNRGVKTIILNRPSRKNAFNRDIYESLGRTLNEDAKNDSVVVTILTGKGDFFSSGNDLKEAMEAGPGGSSLPVVQNMIDSFIKYPKILIAVVNGPAVGIGTTLLALCDVVYASTSATFSTPFVSLGLCAEGGSTYTFPRILGRSLASEMLLLGKKMTAQEAYRSGLVSRLVKPNQIGDVIRELNENLADLPVNSVKVNKKLISAHLESTLLETNRREMKQVLECANSEECMNAMMKFLNRKAKL